MSILILNRSDSPQRTSALRVNHQSIRGRTWFYPAPDGSIARSVRGEVNHIEASGIIVMAERYELNALECASAEPHEHCKPSDHGDAFEHQYIDKLDLLEMPCGKCCYLPQRYPVSLRFDIPVGDGVVPILGDNLILSIRRAEGQIEHQYETEIPGRNLAALTGLPDDLADALADNAKQR